MFSNGARGGGFQNRLPLRLWNVSPDKRYTMDRQFHALALKGTVSWICETVKRGKNKVVNIHPIYSYFIFVYRERESWDVTEHWWIHPIIIKMRRVSLSTFRKRENAINKVDYLFSIGGVAERCRNRLVGTNLGPLLKLSARLEMQYREKETKQTHLKHTITKLAYWNCWARYQLRSSIYLSIYIYKDPPPPSQKMSLFYQQTLDRLKKKKRKPGSNVIVYGWTGKKIVAQRDG